MLKIHKNKGAVLDFGENVVIIYSRKETRVSMDDKEQYTALLLRHRKLVWKLCSRYAKGDYDLCADLVQEVSIALWERYGLLRPKSPFFVERRWVELNTRSVLGHRHRRSVIATVPITPEMAERIAVEQDKGEELIDELAAALSDKEREILQLRRDGYSADEIADRMRMSRPAVYQSIYRIVGKLKQAYDER